MSFSATSDLLPGLPRQPDIALFCAQDAAHLETPFFQILYPFHVGTYPGYAYICHWNKLGYIPLISTLSGSARLLLGIVHTIVHLACAIFDAKNRDSHWQETAFGAKHIARAAAEIIPIANMILFFCDKARLIQSSETFLSLLEDDQQSYLNHMVVTSGNSVIGSMQCPSFLTQLKSLEEGDAVSFQEVYEMMKKDESASL